MYLIHFFYFSYFPWAMVQFWAQLILGADNKNTLILKVMYYLYPENIIIMVLIDCGPNGPITEAQIK